ncbi:MAG: hypothetical protein IPN26_04630 [Bacteroidetes bacterium]|nr:hypothetical protein [Bacteroidota bacterium]
MSTSKNFEVFSFNTAKSPQANTERQHYLNSIKIVDFKSGSSTTFIDSLLNSIQTGTLESLEEVMSLVANFKESGDYISDLNTMNTDNNNILDVFEYLNSLTEFPDDLIDRICETMGLAMLSDINRTEYVQKWDSLWNNLIVNIFSPTSFKFRMGLLHAIQAFKIVMSLFQEKVQTINEIQKLLKSVVIVPNGLLPIHVDRLDPGDNSGQNLNEIHIGWKTKIDLIQSAIIEIKTNQKKYRNLAHEVNTNLDWEIDSEGRPIINPEDLPSVIDFLYLSPERFTELNDITKDFLVDMGIDSSISNKYDDLIFTLSEESNNLYQKVFNPSYASKKGVLEGGAFFSLDDIYSQTSDPAEIGGPIINPYKPCKVAPLGISDYRRVEAIWSRYEPGEIAHIENLLDGEYKDRETRHLRSMEETYTVETIKEKGSYPRFANYRKICFTKEASKIVQNDFEAKLDTYVKGNYGTVNFGVSGGLSFSQSSSNSEMEASQYAREVIDRSVNRLIERTGKRTIRIVEEFEEKNTHKLDNINGGQHKVGVLGGLIK